MDCKKAQFLMALFIANDPALTDQQHINFREHLKSCSDCAEECEESEFAIELAKRYWPISDETVTLIQEVGQSYKPKMTVEEGWKDLCRRCPDLAENTKKPKSLQLFLRIGAVAACLVIGILTWMAFSNYSKQQTLPQKISSQQVVAAPKPFVKVQLVTDTGNIPVTTGHQIASTGRPKTLLINGKHKMIMNSSTVLSFEPLVENSNIGCFVKLASGEIYAHVEHDGNPFVVDTVNGKAVITGTTFDIKAAADDTTLVVTEGKVRFESEQRIVNVAEGQTSKIVGKSAPSIPLSCDTAKLTAWATGYKRNTALAQAGSDEDDWCLALSLRTDPIVLEETDCDHWVEEQRNWFKKEFPWIFELKDALVREGIEVDYPELLIKSGDVWQFVCLQKCPVRFSVPNFGSLLKTATSYGFGREWLLGNVPTAKSALENLSFLETGRTGLAAFDRWLEYINETQHIEQPTPFYSYNASKYLAETRSLIWFAVRDSQYNLTDKGQDEVLALLQEEVAAAYQCQNEVLYAKAKPELSYCEDECRKVGNGIIGFIETMMNIERTLSDFEGSNE